MSTVYVDRYPSSVLAGSETALILFAAAYGGRQDAAFIREAGLRATCVDNDGVKLDAMSEDYPADWEFAWGDVFQFVERCAERTFDVVTADPWTNDFDRVAAILPDLCLIARHTVIVGCAPWTALEAPYGWRPRGRMKRSDHDGGVYWAVLGRA